jgi:hypothetical protein
MGRLTSFGVKRRPGTLDLPGQYVYNKRVDVWRCRCEIAAAAGFAAGAAVPFQAASEVERIGPLIRDCAQASRSSSV